MEKVRPHAVTTWKEIPDMQSPASLSKVRTQGVQLSQRLKDCWELDLDWSLFPSSLKMGCEQVGKALSMPPVAVLSGITVTVSFCMSHAVVDVENTEWVEPVILWLAICMPTGSGKTSLCKYLRRLLLDAKKAIGLDSNSSWMLDDQSFEKMGALMAENNAKSFGLYDELSMFLTQMNVFRGKGIMESHELAVLLKLYGGDSWTRRTVTGDANFSMDYTSLTIGGFMQPSIARNLVENQMNVDKGLCQRFLWIIPRPNPVSYDDMEKVDREFDSSIVSLIRNLWRNDKTIKRLLFPRPCSLFKEKNDLVWQQVQDISCADELLSGMLSKSRGQVLRIAAVFHVLFHLESIEELPNKISDTAISASINFVDYCIQNAAFLAGRGVIEDEIKLIKKDSTVLRDGGDIAKENASFALLLPGKKLYLNALLEQRKFRDRGNKDGAVKGLKVLQEAGLGNLIEIKPQRGATMMYQFEKASIPEDTDGKSKLIETLLTFGVSLTQYRKALAMEDITIEIVRSKKRPSSSEPAHHSPKKILVLDEN